MKKKEVSKKIIPSKNLKRQLLNTELKFLTMPLKKKLKQFDTHLNIFTSKHFYARTVS